MNETTYYEPSSREQANISMITISKVICRLEIEGVIRRHLFCAREWWIDQVSANFLCILSKFFDERMRFWELEQLKTSSCWVSQFQLIAYLIGCIYSLWIWQKKNRNFPRANENQLHAHTLCVGKEKVIASNVSFEFLNEWIKLRL